MRQAAASRSHDRRCFDHRQGDTRPHHGRTGQNPPWICMGAQQGLRHPRSCERLAAAWRNTPPSPLLQTRSGSPLIKSGLGIKPAFTLIKSHCALEPSLPTSGLEFSRIGLCLWSSVKVKVPARLPTGLFLEIVSSSCAPCRRAAPISSLPIRLTISSLRAS